MKRKLTDEVLLRIYERTTGDKVGLGDPRRGAIALEMRDVIGRSRDIAERAVCCWGWDQDGDNDEGKKAMRRMWEWIDRVRKLAGVRKFVL